MRVIVRASFVAFTTPLEGCVPWMYPDVKNLVSTGIGNLIDPIQLALPLPWVRPDGTAAQRDEIAAEWLKVKSLPDDAQGRTAAQLGHLYAQPFTRLRLTPEGVDLVVSSKLRQMDEYLAKRFPGYETWCADAQLGTLSMAWACGPAFRFPKLEAALRAQDFRTAAVECFMPEERTISGLRPRNRANRVLFMNAAIALRDGLDLDALYFPQALADQEPTLPGFDTVHPDVPLDHPALDDDEPPDEVA